MTERKTTEIKIRVTPSEKARWQAESERNDIGLSAWIRGTLNVESEPVPDFASLRHSGRTAQKASAPNIQEFVNAAKSWMYEGKGG